MASRRGRFGRRRTGSSNLTMLIASLMREQRAAEDRAIFDAWQNGGMFKGEKVTDARILAYIKGRRDGFSTDDPLYDEWNNRLIQTEFSIGEQKIGLAFKQGRVGAGAVAAFYRGQLSKIPKDSQFYREVAGRAAEWAKSAGGAARGAGRARAGKALNAKIDGQQAIVDSYDGLEQMLTDVAKRAGMIAGNQTLTDASATDIERLFDMGLTFAGKPVTYETWTGAAKNSYFAQREVIILTEQAGRTTVTKRNKLQKFIDQTLVRANAVDDRAKYEAAREAWQAEMDATNDPRKAIEATKKYLDTLTAIREGAAAVGDVDTNDPEFIGGLTNEITTITTGQAAGPTVTDLQSNTGEGVVTQDAEFIAKMFNDPEHNTGIYIDYQKLVAGTGFFGQADPGGELKVLDYPANAAFDPRGKMGLGDEYTESIITVEGQPEIVHLKGTAVLATVLLVNGQPVPPETYEPAELQRMLEDGTATMQQTEKALGYVFKQPGTGKTTYGVMTADGMMFTDINPFDQIALGTDGALTVLTGNAVASGNGFNFAASAGLNPAAIAALTGQPMPSGTSALKFDPLLADSTVAPSDLATILGPQGNEALNKMVESRRLEAERAKDVRRDKSFGEETDSPIPHLEKAFAASPLGQLLAPSVKAVGDLLKGITIPQSPPTIGKDDLFAPPPPPTLPGSPQLTTKSSVAPPPGMAEYIDSLNQPKSYTTTGTIVEEAAEAPLYGGPPKPPASAPKPKNKPL
jgi:hypothetical protein